MSRNEDVPGVPAASEQPSLKDTTRPAKQRKRAPKGVAIARPETETTADLSSVSVRDGGTVLSALEYPFTIGSSTYIFDSLRLAKVVKALEESDDPASAMLLRNTELGIRDVIYVPAQKNLLRQRPLTVISASTEVVSTDWPYKDHIAGLHVVVGGTGAGKSKFLQDKLKPGITLRWGEPTEPVDSQPNTLQLTDLCEVLSFALVLASLGASVSIDSLRPMMFSIGGAAGPGGVSVGVYSALTDLNNICALAGVAITANVNPMVDGQKEALVYNNIAASVAGMTTVADGAVVAVTVRSTRGRTFTEGSTAPSQVAAPRVWDPRARTETPDEPYLPQGPIIAPYADTPEDEDDLPEVPRTGTRFAL